jgi:signal transduction histidine kinase
MSHELRTPLNAVIGYTDLLHSEVTGPLTETQKKHLSRIRASSWHLLELIQDVLSFARIEAGRETLRFSDVETNKVVHDVVSYVERPAAEKGLRVETDLPSEPVIIITDPGKLRQILLNLLGNAVKFTDQGALGVRLKRDGDGVEFQVWDTGRGIEPENQEMVFEPFTQVDQSTTREKGGVGLGLPVSKQLTHLLGGSLTLTSERGNGTIFYLWLPLQLR